MKHLTLAAACIVSALFAAAAYLGAGLLAMAVVRAVCQLITGT